LAEERVERRLAAILCADVVGYSRLMGADEEGTLAVLKSHRRELIDPLIDQHRGRIFKTTGDGMLIEFASVVDAVRCAVVVQQGWRIAAPICRRASASGFASVSTSAT
jgi:adenylate cyclase